MRTLPRLLVTCLVSTFGVAAAQTRQPGVVLLKNDRVLHGEVSNEGDRYVVFLAENSSVRIPAEQVVVVGENLLDVYQHRVSDTSRWTPGDHFQLSKWCMAQNLLPQAAEHYLKVAERVGRDRRVKQLGEELKLRILAESDFRQHLGLAPRRSPEPARAPVRLASDSGSTPDDDAPSVTTADYVKTASEHPAILRRYAGRIQPILVNRCSQAACHGSRSESELRILESHGQTAAETNRRNLHSVLEQVSADPERESPLLEYATSAHGLKRAPSIASSETYLLEELQEWIALVQDPPESGHDSPVRTAIHNGSTQGLSPVARAAAQQPWGNAIGSPANFRPFQTAVEIHPVAPGATELGATALNAPVGSGRTAIDVDFPDGQQPPGTTELDALEAEIERALSTPGSNAPSGDRPSGIHLQRSWPSNEGNQPDEIQPGGTQSSGGQRSGTNPRDPFDPTEFNRRRQQRASQTARTQRP